MGGDPVAGLELPELEVVVHGAQPNKGASPALRLYHRTDTPATRGLPPAGGAALPPRVPPPAPPPRARGRPGGGPGGSPPGCSRGPPDSPAPSPPAWPAGSPTSRTP